MKKTAYLNLIPAIILLTITVVQATTSPTIGWAIAGGNNGPCTWYISIDGTTPVAKAQTQQTVLGVVYKPGDNYVGTSGQDMGAFMNVLTTPYMKYCMGTGPFTFTTPWIMSSNITITGLGAGSLLQAGANSMDIMAFTNAGQATNPQTTNVVVRDLKFSSNLKTNVNGLDFNESMFEMSNHIELHNLHFSGAGWKYLIIGDGNEDSLVSGVYTDDICAGDISWKAYTGNVQLDHIIFGYISPQFSCAGGWIRTISQNVFISYSTITGVIHENQRGSQTGSGGTNHNTSGLISIENSFLCNAGGDNNFMQKPGQAGVVYVLQMKGDTLCVPSGKGIIATNATGTTIVINSVRFASDKISLADPGGNFLHAPASGSSIIIQKSLAIESCYLTTTNGKWANTNAATGVIQVTNFHYIGNYMNGAQAAPGDYVSAGNGNYYMYLEPAGFEQTAPGVGGSTPALPAGLGSGNFKVDQWGWPVTIYMNITSSSGTVLQTGIHVIDSQAVDKALLGNPQSITIYTGEKVYFATNVPYAWLWYGNAW